MRSKRFLFILLLIVLIGWAAPTQARQPALQDEMWLPGQYTGWVYFLARSDIESTITGEGIYITDTAVLYHESHGNLDCTVFDDEGNGICNANFPLDMIGTSSESVQTPDCNLDIIGNYRAIGISEMNPVISLVPVPLADGFSLNFNPAAGPFTGEMKVTASGGGVGCKSQVLSSEIPRGIQWSDLDFHMESHNGLSFGGACSMADFPREMPTPHGFTTAVIEECKWQVFYFDPYAEFPEE